LRDGVAIRLPQQGQLLAAVTSQAPIAFHTERRQNGVDPVTSRSQ
jgi:hypothetical protein